MELYKSTVYRETIYLAGSIPQLGNWNASSAPALSWANYTSTNNEWYLTFFAAPGTSFQYKYTSTLNLTTTWEPDPNR